MNHYNTVWYTVHRNNLVIWHIHIWLHVITRKQVHHCSPIVQMLIPSTAWRFHLFDTCNLTIGAGGLEGCLNLGSYRRKGASKPSWQREGLVLPAFKPDTFWLVFPINKKVCFISILPPTVVLWLFLKHQIYYVSYNAHWVLRLSFKKTLKMFISAGHTLLISGTAVQVWRLGNGFIMSDLKNNAAIFMQTVSFLITWQNPPTMEHLFP